MREFEVQLGVAQPRTGVEKRGFGGKQLACAGFESLLRNRLCGEKLLRAVGVAFCERKTRLDFLHLRERALQFNQEDITKESFLEKLNYRLSTADVNQVKADVLPFIHNPKELDIWSNDYFLQLAKMIRFE